MIAISPIGHYIGEANIINLLLERGLERYHLRKSNATEQYLSEILNDVNPKYLSQISLHSHFHLVLAFGVGGIHYSDAQQQILKSDLEPKIKLYQGFGIKVSVDISNSLDKSNLADYAFLISPSNKISLESKIYIQDHQMHSHSIHHSAFVLDRILWNCSDPLKRFDQIISEFS